MKLTATSAIATFITTALAAPFDAPHIRPMVPSTTTFNVTGFQAYSVIQDPTWSFVHFNISTIPTYPNTFCTSYVITPASHTIGSFPLTNCSDDRVQFNLTRTEDNGAELVVLHHLAPPGPGLRKGTFKIPSDWFREKAGGELSESFVGPQSFFVEDLELVQPIWG